MKTPLRTGITVVLASAVLLGCSDRSNDDNGIDAADDGPETPGDESTTEPETPDPTRPDPEDECAYPRAAGSAVWPCSGELPEPFNGELPGPYNDKPRCVWDDTNRWWSCFDNSCARGADVTDADPGIEFDPEVWVCRYKDKAGVRMCVFDDWPSPFSAPFFDCPAECEVMDDSMTCPDFECEYDFVADIWTCY